MCRPTRRKSTRQPREFAPPDTDRFDLLSGREGLAESFVLFFTISTPPSRPLANLHPRDITVIGSRDSAHDVNPFDRQE